jgi:hypothetical protein
MAKTVHFRARPAGVCVESLPSDISGMLMSLSFFVYKMGRVHTFLTVVRVRKGASAKFMTYSALGAHEALSRNSPPLPIFTYPEPLCLSMGTFILTFHIKGKPGQE